MVSWHRSRRADFGLRACGLLSGGVAYAAIAYLAALRMPMQAAGGIAYVLAAIGFVGASAGSAMLFLGGHLFDEVELGERWRRYSHGRPAASRSNTHPLGAGEARPAQKQGTSHSSDRAEARHVEA